jgi:hypothetical protein
MPNQVAAPVLAVGGVNADILPSPERKVRKTSHQEQIRKQNKSKRKAVHAQAHAHTTTLFAEERAKPKDVHRTTVQVIQQVDGEFSAHGYGIILSIPTINQYIALGMVCTFPLTQGCDGTMLPHSFNLLVLVAELFIQINKVNSGMVE